MTTTIVFDVNETLLDLAAMDPMFERHFGDASVRREWFAQVLMTTLTMTLVGDYANFAKIGEAALAMVSERRGVSTSDTPMCRRGSARFETRASASPL
jgi:2-haloacid dehalogenase